VKRQQESGSHFNEREVMATFAQCCLGLQHAHARYILHRDVKCKNIFLTRAGVVKLGDYGIAKVLESTNANAGTRIGTPYYTSPEVCDDRAYGLKSDIWSIGVVLHELLALELPFQASNLVILLLKIVQGEPRPLPEMYSEEARDIVHCLLQKRPEDRPTCDELLEMAPVRCAVANLSQQQGQLPQPFLWGRPVDSVFRSRAKLPRRKATIEKSGLIKTDPAEAVDELLSMMEKENDVEDGDAGRPHVNTVQRPNAPHTQRHRSRDNEKLQLKKQSSLDRHHPEDSPSRQEVRRNISHSPCITHMEVLGVRGCGQGLSPHRAPAPHGRRIYPDRQGRV